MLLQVKVFCDLRKTSGKKSRAWSVKVRCKLDSKYVSYGAYASNVPSVNQSRPSSVSCAACVSVAPKIVCINSILFSLLFWRRYLGTRGKKTKKSMECTSSGEETANRCANSKHTQNMKNIKIIIYEAFFCLPCSTVLRAWDTPNHVMVAWISVSITRGKDHFCTHSTENEWLRWTQVEDGACKDSLFICVLRSEGARKVPLVFQSSFIRFKTCILYSPLCSIRYTEYRAHSALTLTQQLALVRMNRKPFTSPGSTDCGQPYELHHMVSLRLCSMKKE